MSWLADWRLCPVSITACMARSQPHSTLSCNCNYRLLSELCVCVFVCLRVFVLAFSVSISSPPQVMQGLAWVSSTVLLKFMLSTILCASDDVRYSHCTLWNLGNWKNSYRNTPDMVIIIFWLSTKSSHVGPWEVTGTWNCILHFIFKSETYLPRFRLA